VNAVVLRGDARRLPLPDGCVDLVVTSPPYFGLRSYTDDGAHYDGQIGSEATPAEWLAALVGCTAEWVRVLKPSGSLFVNLGDKYSGVDPSSYRRDTQPLDTCGKTGYTDHKMLARAGTSERSNSQRPDFGGTRPKSLLGLPWRYALACMDELGLILRRDIIWSKPNGLPESVTDRCRSSHEYLFHFTVQPRYYAAVDEIREPHTAHTLRYYGPGTSARQPRRPYADDSGRGDGGGFTTVGALGKLPGSVWDIPSQPLTVPPALGVDHFAAFPMELPRRCVLGWSPPGVCTACGEGRRPVVDSVKLTSRPGLAVKRRGQPLMDNGGNQSREGRAGDYRATITGYACACPEPDAPVRPALVVDPFGGTGTTALVAAAYGRTGVSVDLSGDYCRLARWRTADPAERARALEVPKPPPVPDGQGSLFDDMEAS